MLLPYLFLPEKVIIDLTAQAVESDGRSLSFTLFRTFALETGRIIIYIKSDKKEIAGQKMSGATSIIALRLVISVLFGLSYIRQRLSLL